MEILIRLLLRFILVPLGAAAALVAAAAVILFAHRNAVLAALDGDPQARLDYLTGLLFAGPLLAALLSISAFHALVPAAVGVLISEALAIRSWLFHTANGGLSAWFGWALTQEPPPYPPALAAEAMEGVFAGPRVLIAAGLLAGLAYWIVSGWTAGFWKPLRSPGQAARPP